MRESVDQWGTNWREVAACRKEDPDLFFPEGYGPKSTAQIQQAQAICAECPVTSQCLGAAIRTGEREGIWGGRLAQQLPRLSASA